MREGLLWPFCRQRIAKNIYTFRCITSQALLYAGGTARDATASGFNYESATPVGHSRRHPGASRSGARSSSVVACAAAGFDVTQATLSRDIRELGLVKGGPDGAYQAAPRSRRTAIRRRRCSSARWRRSCVASIACSSSCSLRTGLGHAQSLVRAARRGRAARCGRARSPARTRFSSSRRMSGGHGRSSSGSRRCRTHEVTDRRWPMREGFTPRRRFPGSSRRYGVDVVTVTLDVGQGDELGELRARALVVRRRARSRRRRARRVRARRAVPLALRVRRRATHTRRSRALAWPLIARKLIEIARIEGAAPSPMARSTRRSTRRFMPSIRRMPIIAPAREWTMSGADLLGYARARGCRQTGREPNCRIDQNLWGRLMRWELERRPAEARLRARADLERAAHRGYPVRRGVPVSVNGVPMSPAELIECLSLIGGQHGVGRLESHGDGRHVLYDAPAATMLHAAAPQLGDRTGADVSVRLQWSVHRVERAIASMW